MIREISLRAVYYRIGLPESVKTFVYRILANAKVIHDQYIFVLTKAQGGLNTKGWTD